MQYCVKCNNVTDDKVTVCPVCRHGRGLREARDNDLVTFGRMSEYEADNARDLFEEYGISFEIKPYKIGLATSPYNTEILPTDKSVFVAYKDVETAKKLLAESKGSDARELDEEPVDPQTKKRNIIVEIITTLAFLSAVTLLFFAAAPVADWLKELLSRL